MLRRLVLFLVVIAITFGLLFVQNKVMVGEQELQATLHQVERPGELGRTYSVVFTDLAGNPLDATRSELDAVVRRLAPNSRFAGVTLQKIHLVEADHNLEFTVDQGVDDVALRQRMQGTPFKRPAEPRDLFHVTKGIDLRGGVEFICQLRNDSFQRVAADDEVMKVLRERLDVRGLTEPVVAKLSNGDIQVVIPGGTTADAARTRKVLEDTGRLEFRELIEEFDGVRLDDPASPVVRREDGSYHLRPQHPAPAQPTRSSPSAPSRD